ncbi:cupredoxin domain-containing protein [Streptomyces lincolnensis]|uniref:cupredoxin domain-containing protein n=1 Tax=Streptomyces lincolnensis TaxID=1915 RepID=UPI001E402C64|nr:cupredoxin family copper-binding protein [Streptomyces lincolnensis]MCD7441687.1 cupredoxin domain-containing protein [Streptomyces lincolnensis]
MRAPRKAAVAAVLALLALPLLPASQASAATYRVTMKGYAFSPASLTVPAGSTVTWTNQDTAPHDVKTTSGPASIHSPMLDKGQSWSFTFTAAGSYGYYCTVHPDMTAGITVSAPAPTHHHTEDPGTSGSGSSHTTPEHHAPTPSRPAMSRMPSPTRPSTAQASPTATSPGAAAPQPSQPPAGSPQPAQQPQTVTTASTARPLDPLLLLAGLVAGVAVMCLLLVGSRAAAAAARDEEDA